LRLNCDHSRESHFKILDKRPGVLQLQLRQFKSHTGVTRPLIVQLLAIRNSDPIKNLAEVGKKDIFTINTNCQLVVYSPYISKCSRLEGPIIHTVLCTRIQEGVIIQKNQFLKYSKSRIQRSRSLTSRLTSLLMMIHGQMYIYIRVPVCIQNE
jgi:hypothetical protein